MYFTWSCTIYLQQYIWCYLSSNTKKQVIDILNIPLLSILKYDKVFWNTFSLSLEPLVLQIRNSQKPSNCLRLYKIHLNTCIICLSQEKGIKLVDTGYKIKFKNSHLEYFWFLDLYLNLRLSFTKQQNLHCN